MSSSLVGRTLGNYKVIDTLGQGGMATVYLGYQETVDRQVAIKVLPPHPGLDANFARRFQLEARTIARLQHPHILPLYDYGQQDDILYLVMAYADGGTLEDLIIDGPTDISLTNRILHNISEALDYAHRQGIIHRDIKPGNILLDSEGHAMLADFGIVKLAEGSSGLTGTNIVGTPAYMSPEQAQGAVIDHRADIYSLGVVVFQMLTGQLPFNAPSLMQVMLKVMQEPPPDILEIRRSLPLAVSEVMKTVLAKEPDDRYQTAAEFAKEFSMAIKSQGETLQALRESAGIDPVTRPISQQMPAPSTEVIPSLSESKTDPRIPYQTDPGSQTVIVQQQTDPLILLGGFAIVGIVLVVVVLLVMATLNRDRDSSEEPTGTQVAVQDEDGLIDEDGNQIELVPESTAQLFGRVSYSTVNSLGDTVTVRVENLSTPPSGNVYHVWLINTETDSSFSLGSIPIDPLGNGALSFTDPDGALLSSDYNAVALSVETSGSVGDAPSDDIRYSGSIPVSMPAILREIFVESIYGLGGSGDTEDSENVVMGGSLLDGARREAMTAVQHSGLAANASSVGGMHTHAEHTINILRGETEDYDGSGRGENPGRGVGVFAFLDRIESGLIEAVQAEGTTRRLQSDAEFILVCISNSRQRANRIIEFEQEMLASDSLEAVREQAQESTTTAEQLVQGFDLNENGQVEAFEGECGLNQIETFGILASGIDIVRGAPGS